jgi:uncharacterized protein YjbJ (UPF0337 family)
MGNTAKRGKGAAKELGGKAQRKLGKLAGNERMQARGRARELEGQAEQEGAKARERLAGKVEETIGSAERRAAPLAKKAVEVHGGLKRAVGRLRQKLHRASDDEPDA